MMKKINWTSAKMSLLAAAATVSTAMATTEETIESLDDVVSPVVKLINQLTGPALAIVGALGALYCIILGVKFAKAEEPQDREKAKTHLKNAIIGFVLIFVLILLLNRLMPFMINWVNSQAIGGNNVIS